MWSPHSDWMLATPSHGISSLSIHGFIPPRPRLLELMKENEDNRKKMIECLSTVISGLERNREILKRGGRLENEHWTDIAGTFRGCMELFMNQP